MAQERPRRVLLIEDDPDVVGLLRALCRDAGVQMDEAPDGDAGLAVARERVPDLILLDVVLPGKDGIEITREMRQEPRLAAVPVVILSARRTQATKVAAFEAGADDYVVKPFGLSEIDARIRANLRKRDLYARLEKTNLELQLANERLAELATTDELTGLLNSRAARDRLAEEFHRASRYETPLSLIMADLDGFKQLNDTHGHPAGDKLLAQLAQRLRATARTTDIVGRYGGDEFIFILPHTGLPEALKLAERLTLKLAQAPLRLPGGRLVPLRLSCGVATLPDSGPLETAEDILEAADRALYAAKKSGGGAVVAARMDSPLGENRAEARIESVAKIPIAHPPRALGVQGPGLFE